MRLATARQTYFDSTAKASDIARQLAFAGIALIWVFSGAKNGNDVAAMPERLLNAGFWLCLSLAFDFLQYVVKAAVWGFWHRSLEKKLFRENGRIDDETESEAPPWINYPAIGLFWFKLWFVAVSFANIGLFLWASKGAGAISPN